VDKTPAYPSFRLRLDLPRCFTLRRRSSHSTIVEATDPSGDTLCQVVRRRRVVIDLPAILCVVGLAAGATAAVNMALDEPADSMSVKSILFSIGAFFGVIVLGAMFLSPRRRHELLVAEQMLAIGWRSRAGVRPGRYEQK
jgi:hypothetical protein